MGMREDFMLERACEEIIGLRARVAELENGVKECDTERLFWRRAAEQALRLWDRAQDEIEQLEARSLYVPGDE